MDKKTQQWLKQADYDMDTAELMFNGGRFFYAVFMCHLSIEKAVKGLYQKRLKQAPPKIHNLVFFLNKMGIKPPEDIGRFIVKLSEANVVTRYPEDIDKLQADYTEVVVKDILIRSKELLEWIKEQF